MSANNVNSTNTEEDHPAQESSAANLELKQQVTDLTAELELNKAALLQASMKYHSIIVRTHCKCAKCMQLQKFSNDQSPSEDENVHLQTNVKSLNAKICSLNEEIFALRQADNSVRQLQSTISALQNDYDIHNQQLEEECRLLKQDIATVEEAQKLKQKQTDEHNVKSSADERLKYREQLAQMKTALMRQSAAHKALDERRTACSEQMRQQFHQVHCQLQKELSELTASNRLLQSAKTASDAQAARYCHLYQSLLQQTTNVASPLHLFTNKTTTHCHSNRRRDSSEHTNNYRHSTDTSQELHGRDNATIICIQQQLDKSINKHIREGECADDYEMITSLNVRMSKAPSDYLTAIQTHYLLS